MYSCKKRSFRAGYNKWMSDFHFIIWNRSFNYTLRSVSYLFPVLVFGGCRYEAVGDGCYYVSTSLTSESRACPEICSAQSITPAQFETNEEFEALINSTLTASTLGIGVEQLVKTSYNERFILPSFDILNNVDIVFKYSFLY